MDKNNQNNGQSLDRVESRIELLEKQLMEKDKELKRLLNASKDKDEKIAELQDDISDKDPDTFVPVFKQSTNSESDVLDEEHEDDANLPEGLKKQLKIIEQREDRVKEMLEVLEEAFGILSARNAALNKKEEILNHEYFKLLEIEAMYKGTDQLADSLDSVLPSLGLNDQKDQSVEKVAEGQIEE